MQADVLHIDEKINQGELDIAKLEAFRWRQGPRVDAQIIIDQPQITLYCLDDRRRQAVFVEAPPDLDLSQQPFYFRAQYQNAQRLLTVPYETLHELAGIMGDRFQRLTPMYSVGRCGGTLVSRALNRLGTVLSLDEPDVYNNIVVMRPADGSRDAELTRLLHSCTRLLFKSSRPGTDTLFIKFRPFSIEIGDLMYKAFPAAKTMFLYRNAEAWVRSVGASIRTLIESAGPEQTESSDSLMNFLRLMDIMKPAGAVEPPARSRARKSSEDPAAGPTFLKRATPLLPGYIRSALKDRLTGKDRLTFLFLAIAQRLPVLKSRCQTPIEYLEPHMRAAVSPMKLLTLWWLGTMERYMAMHKQGIPMLAVQYETLVSQPQASLRTIFEYCGLPADKVSMAEGAFAEDSQKGTPLSRERVGTSKRSALGPELLVQMREVLREHPPILTPDFVVPGSLQVAKAGR